MGRFRVCTFVAFGLALAACARGGSAVAPLAPVASLPEPPLPPWITAISPTGRNVGSLAQIRILFSKPIATLSGLAGDGPADVLSHLRIAPALAGQFVVLTPRMIAFVPSRALPVATRVRVTLTAGLRDLDGDVLGSDLAWTFESRPLKFTGLPSLKAPDYEPTPGPVGLTPTLTFTANARLDPASLATRVALVGGGADIPATASLEAQPTPMPGTGATAAFDPSLDIWTYDVRPQQRLRRGTRYTLVLKPGIAPAYGNLPSAAQTQGHVRTYGAFGLIEPQPKPSPGYSVARFAGGDPSIAFTNPLDPKSIAGAVTVSPAPAAVKTIALAYPGSNLLALDPYALDPNATYTVTIAGTLKDAFGQQLGTAQRVTIHTGSFAAGAWAPTGWNTIAASAGVALNFYATKLPKKAYRFAARPLAPVALLTGSDPLAQLPLPATWPSKAIAGAKRNVQSVVHIPLERLLGAPYGTLAYGIGTALDAGGQPQLTGIVQLTDLGIFAQYFPGAGAVMVQRLDDGAPAPGVALTFYRIDSSGNAAPQRCATGVTGADGTFALTGPPLQSCYALSSVDNAPTIGVVATQGSDVASLTTYGWSGIYRFNVTGGWTGGAPLSRGTIFSDRQLYQPGERGDLTGVAYYASGNGLVAEKDARYRVTLTDPSNATTSLGSVRTDRYGIFTLPIAFSTRQPLGYYTVSAKGPSGNTLTGTLRVAEFRPPNFAVKLALSGASAVAGGSIHAAANAQYLFGAPLQGGVAHVTVTRDVATLAPKGWDDFSFGPQWFYPEQPPSFDTDVMQRDTAFDAQGNAAFDVAVPKRLPFPMTYTVDVNATDVSNLSVAADQTFLALPADAIVGLASDVVGAAGAPMTIRTIVTDAAGKPLAGRAVHLVLQRMTYTSATQEIAGGENAQQAIAYKTVATADITSAVRPVRATLTPPDPGPYRVEANFAGAQGRAGATDIAVFAFGGSAADWGSSTASSTPVKLDAKRYKVGEVATALVASPYRKADVYVSVIRNGVLYHTVLRDVSGSPRVRFTVTPDMVPNAAVEAVVVRRGSDLAAVKPGSVAVLSTVGMAGFTVDLKDRYLKVGIAPAQATVRPGGTQRVTFTLRNAENRPVAGEVVAMVVDDAILNLSGYRLPDLVNTVFASQPISTVFSDNRENLVLTTQTPPVEKGFGYGGGYLAGAASTRVRENFLPLAYFGKVETDVAGKAVVSFHVPDNLTTWRVMAIAVASDDRHFGTADRSFVATLPLSTNPLLPQFARPGDRFDAGVSVSNQTGAAGALALVLKLGGALRFAGGDPFERRASEQAATGMQGYRFPVTVGTPAPSTFAVNSALGAAADAFSVDFAVLDGSTTSSRIDAGATTSQAVVRVGNVAGGRVDVMLANSIVPQFAVAAQSHMSDDWLPLADVAASRLEIASALATLQKPYGLAIPYDPRAAAADALTKLLALQRDDGGFAGCSAAASSDPFVSAYALDALAFARAHGVSVAADALTRAKRFASQTLANPGRFTWCADATCKAQVRFAMLWALAANGDRRTSFLSGIVAARASFTVPEQIRLARYLLKTPGWIAQGAALGDALQRDVYLSGRYATANVNGNWGWLASSTGAQAQMLQLLIERNAPIAERDGAVRALVAQACNCGWPTVDDTASALVALAAYAATEHLAAATVTLTAGGTTIAQVRFGATASSRQIAVPASALGSGAIEVRSSGGTVHYLVRYVYPVPANAPGELTAFRVTRTVRAAGASAPLATMDLATAAPVTLGVGQVFDVGVRVVVDHPVDRIAIVDPLPAGMEAVHASFSTSSATTVARSDSWQIDAQQIYRDRVEAFAQHLDPGVYAIHYLARTVTPGTYAWPGARAYLIDAPEQLGRSAATTLTVR